MAQPSAGVARLVGRGSVGDDRLAVFVLPVAHGQRASLGCRPAHLNVNLGRPAG